MREKKKQEIINFCKENKINLINLRNMKKQGKTRIIVTFLCNECGTRYDMMWDNVKTQEFIGSCTKCAHKKSQDYRRLQAQDVINKFVQNGYKVITPIDKIKPRGKNKSYNRAVVTVEDNFGYQFNVTYNAFRNKIDYYKKLNELGDNAHEYNSHKFEQKVKEVLDELKIPYKREFVVIGLKSIKKGTFRFDFCLFYTEPSKRLFIEVDEKYHNTNYRNIKERDKQKNYYCEKNNIPLLRIKQNDIGNGEYKQMITDFLNKYN